jgi:hypothetical protein
MEKLLGNLRNHLNETLLKEAEFTIHSKQAVLEAVREKGKANTRTPFWKQGLSISFTAVLFAGVLLFAASLVEEVPAQLNNTPGDNALNESPSNHSMDAVFWIKKKIKKKTLLKQPYRQNPLRHFEQKAILRK